MKTLLLLLFVSSSAFSQFENFNTYEMQKKDKATAYLLSALPAAGLQYAQPRQSNLIWSVAEVVLVYWAVKENSENRVFPIFALANMKIFELIEVSRAVDKYNHELRIKLQLTIN